MSLAAKIIEDLVMEQYDCNNGSQRPDPGSLTYVPDTSDNVISVTPVDAPAGSVARCLVNGKQNDGYFSSTYFIYTDKDKNELYIATRDEVAIISMLTLDEALKCQEAGPDFAERMGNDMWCVYHNNSVTPVIRDDNRVVSTVSVYPIDTTHCTIIGKYVPVITNKYLTPIP